MAIILDDIKKVTEDLSVLSVDDGKISEKLKSVNKSVINKMSIIDEKVNQIKSGISSIKDTTQVLASRVQSYTEKSDSLFVSIKQSMDDFTSLISVLKVMFHILVGVGLFTFISVIGILIYLFYKKRKMYEEGYIHTE